ncbi:hypothetical protein OAS67_00940 [Alphaproteobacteria bacterium]|jgi:hypothetical protein|nr:hypothetical protein [Alphaproteobacteria bacterium]
MSEEGCRANNFRPPWIQASLLTPFGKGYISTIRKSNARQEIKAIASGLQVGLDALFIRRPIPPKELNNAIR